jgi:hypothetical protein
MKMRVTQYEVGGFVAEEEKQRQRKDDIVSIHSLPIF